MLPVRPSGGVRFMSSNYGEENFSAFPYLNTRQVRVYCGTRWGLGTWEGMMMMMMNNELNLKKIK